MWFEKFTHIIGWVKLIYFILAFKYVYVRKQGYFFLAVWGGEKDDFYLHVYEKWILVHIDLQILGSRISYVGYLIYKKPFVSLKIVRTKLTLTKILWKINFDVILSYLNVMHEENKNAMTYTYHLWNCCNHKCEGSPLLCSYILT